MQDRGEEFEPGTWGYRFRVALAPTCLLLVAGLHFVRVHAFDQTPWKGGGFGMFSTVDTREARFLKIFLLSDGREIPVAAPKWLEKRAEEVSAAPSAEAVAEFADRMAKLAWIDRESRWRQIAARATPAAARHEFGVELLAQPPATSAAARVPRLEPGPRPDIEAVRPAEAEREAAYLVNFQAVRVELWRYRFDAAENRLSAARTLAAERPRGGPATLPQPATAPGEVAQGGAR